MDAPRDIALLVERFDRNRESYRAAQYNETQLRREFIDPFFDALGWDVNNRQGFAEAYKEVIHEDSIRVGSATKAPDYCFRIGGARKFFLEIVKSVERMLTLHRQQAAAKTPHKKESLRRQIQTTDTQIDRLVYDLYGLTEEEIRIVEGHAPS